jgi:hypothetical protein
VDYDIERAKQEQAEIRKAFREIFPLAAESDLPWAASHIKNFLRDRIKREVQEGVFHFQSAIVRVLCEISPPKTHVVDMARIVVEAARDGRRFQEQLESVKKERDELRDALRERIKQPEKIIEEIKKDKQ